MIMSIIVTIVWFLLGICGFIWDALTYKFNFFFVLYIVLAPCLPFIWHMCGLF